MLKILFFILTAILVFTLSSRNTHAIIDPLSIPNNKFGVHILFTTELSEAARLVNSSGGDWGYITIPIQAGDKDLVKWQKFMDDSISFHLIPIIRISTENYYFNTRVWRKPNEGDVLDFANFLNSLNWPTKNRYVVIFNEVNRSDEWGDEVNPEEYAKILEYAVSIFKSKNEDFYIISAGLDNASGNLPKESMNQYDFMTKMNNAVPGIFNQIDGLGSHAYPNPAFSQPPSTVTPKSIASFKYERDLSKNFSNKSLPVFITETGWSQEKVGEFEIASYYEEAFKSVWNDENIVAVTPFLLRAGIGPFAQFSLINNKGNLIYETLLKLPKIKGSPIVSKENLSVDKNRLNDNLLPSKYFFIENDETNKFIKLDMVKTILKWFFRH